MKTNWYLEFKLWQKERDKEDARVSAEAARNEARLLAWRLKRAHRCTYDLAPHQNTTNIANKPAPER